MGALVTMARNTSISWELRRARRRDSRSSEGTLGAIDSASCPEEVGDHLQRSFLSLISRTDLRRLSDSGSDRPSRSLGLGSSMGASSWRDFGRSVGDGDTAGRVRVFWGIGFWRSWGRMESCVKQRRQCQVHPTTPQLA